MRKIIFAILFAGILCACTEKENTSSPWDHTSWNFSGTISANASAGSDPSSAYSVNFPNGFTLDIENVKEGKYKSDWFSGDMEQTADGGLRFYSNYSGTQVIDAAGEKITYKISYVQEMTITRTDDNNATGYFSQDQTTEVDGSKYEAHFSGILKGTRK